jgi:hypothetical protein
MYICIHIYIVRVGKSCISEFEGTTEVGEGKKMLGNEKYWNNIYIYIWIKYNVLCCNLLNIWGYGEEEQ